MFAKNVFGSHLESIMWHIQPHFRDRHHTKAATWGVPALRVTPACPAKYYIIINNNIIVRDYYW